MMGCTCREEGRMGPGGGMGRGRMGGMGIPGIPGGGGGERRRSERPSEAAVVAPVLLIVKEERTKMQLNT